jgi:hypothetical protein
MMIIGVLMIEGLISPALMEACDERESFNQAGRCALFCILLTSS